MYIPSLPFSGVAGWRVLTQTESQQRTAHNASAEIVRDVEYFKNKIASVRSSDDLLADRRLLEVALTAYGLQEEIDKRAFIKLVLDGGTDDDSSFANRLNDKRWREFAKAFGFGDAGSGSEISAFEASVALKFRGQAGSGGNYLDPLEIGAYRKGIASVASVDDLLADETVLKVALAAFGLERGYYTDDHFRQLLTEGVSDPNSYANKMTDKRWAEFAKAFEGLADGQPLKTVSQLQLDVERELERRGVGFDLQADADASSKKISSDDLAYFQATVETMLSGEDVVADARALKVVKVAFGLTGETLSNAEIEALIDDAIAGDFTKAKAQGNYGWTLLAQSVATTVNGGSAARHKNFAYQIELGIADNDLEYIDAYDAPSTPTPVIDAEELAYFRENAKTIETAADLFADERALTVALTAFGLENSSYSKSFLQSVLEEDPADSNSLVNFTSDANLKAFIEAFHGDTGGGSADLWRLELEDRLTALDAPQEDIDYLRKNFNLISSNLDFVLDKKLMDITLSAFGIEKNRYGSTFFISALISDPTNENSFINVLGDERFQEMASVIGSYAGMGGNTALESFQNTVADRYKAKMFAQSIGDQDESLRLAINFRDEIGTIAGSSSVETAGWYQLMGDTPLRTVLDGALGLPSEFSQIDVDAQVEVYKKRAGKLFGVSNPSAFLDSANVNRMIELYLVNQEISANPTGFTPGYGALTLMQGAASNARRISFSA